jgi:prepilin-type N-terminal cleavage/methylation domain-containing protein
VKKREAGFTLIEMMISIAISMFVLAAALTFFLISVRQYKVQTKIVETNVEGVLGLELLRQDLEGLGFGLPWNPSALPAYTERPFETAAIAALDDTPNPPRAVVSIDCASMTVNRSDYLVIKSTRVGMDNAAGKWTTLKQTTDKRTWVPAAENLVNTDFVTVLTVGSTDTNRRSLVSTGSPSTWLYSNTGLFVPTEPYSANIVYGIGATQPVRPFNRAEYYIGNATNNPPVAVPQRCAPNTGVLVKAVVAHNASGTTPNPLPLLDCVADMQVVYGLDTNADGAVDPPWVSDISGMTAAAIRTQLAEVRVHILAQEGERDDSYRTPTDNVIVGSQGEGNNFDVSLFRNYRWKTYSIVTKPKNLAR